MPFSPILIFLTNINGEATNNFFCIATGSSRFVKLQLSFFTIPKFYKDGMDWRLCGNDGTSDIRPAKENILLMLTKIRESALFARLTKLRQCVGLTSTLVRDYRVVLRRY